MPSPFMLKELELHHWGALNEQAKLQLLRDLVLELIAEKDDLVMEVEDNKAMCDARNLRVHDQG